MSKCKDIRGELGTVHLLYLKSKVKGDSVDQVGMNLKNLIKKLISKYEGPSLNQQILDEFYESAANIFKGYNRSNKITSDYLRDVEKQDPSIQPEIIEQGTYLNARLKPVFSQESKSSKFVNLSKIDSTDDLMDIFNGSSELYGLFMKRFNTDILNMTVFGFNSNNEVAFNNSTEQLNNNINSWLHGIDEEFASKFKDEYANVDSSSIAQELVDITRDDKSGLYRKFVSLHFKKLIELSQNKIIRAGKKGGYEPKISSSLRTGWTNNEFISSFDELGDFVKELVETRKIISLDGTETGQTLNWSRIFFAVSKLYHYSDRTNNYYLDEVISDIIEAKKANKITGKIVKESKIFDDINIDEWNTLNSLYVHFFNKDKNGFKSKNENIFHSFYVRSNNSYKDSSSRNSNIIDYYDMVKYNFEKQLTNKYSQVVYDYDAKTFIQEDLNTIRTNKQRSMYVSGLNMYKDLFGYENLAEQIKKISPYFEVDTTTVKDGYVIKYKGVELLNTSKLSTFNLSSINTDDDFNNLNKLINYVISVNPTVTPTDIIQYDLNKSINKRIKDNDVIYNTYTKTLLPILNRVLSIVGNKELQIYSESEVEDSSAYKMALTEYSKWLDVMSGDNIKAVTLTAEGTFVPSFGQINMIKEVGTLVSFLKKSINKNKIKKSPLSNNIFMQGDNAKFLMEPITDTFIYFKGKAIPVAKAGSTELFINHFMIKYLYNIANDDYNIQIQPTTFADKSKQTAIRVNSESFIDLNTRSKQSLANKSNKELKTFLLNNIDTNYNLIINHVIETLNSALDVNFKTLKELQKYIKDKQFKNSDIIKSANSKGLNIFSTLFFQGGEINSLLLEIESNPRKMSELIQDDLTNSLQMIEDENISIDYEMFKPTIKKLLEGKYGVYFGETLENFEKNWVDQNTGRIIMSKESKINPLYERYFYEKNIYSENFRNLIAGSIAMHPAKGGTKNFMENVAKRYVAQTKRTVGMQGTIHPYRLGMYNGVPYYERVAFVEDPNMALFNQLGNTHNQEVTDGASFSIFLSTILKNNSLLDQGGQQHHKSLGMMIDPASGSFMLMKHADHSMTNERLRNSKYAEFNLNNIVKKMLNQPIDLNIDLTKDFNGKDIYKKGSASYKINGINYTVLDIVKQEGNNYNFIVESNDGISTDILIKTVQINSLHDLWINLGGENSTTINTTTGKSIYDNSSWYNLADFVNKVGFYKNEKALSNFINNNSDKFTNYKSFRKNIIGSRYDDDSSKEYIDERPTADSIYQPLKNKFISQITFTSAQKVGAVNPNASDVLSNDEPLMSFDNYSSIYTGLQLDHEHHTDDSDITEPTQILSAILFNGDASQYNRQLQLGIKLSIIHNVAKYLKTNTSLKDIDLDKIREVVGNNFLTELKKKDLSNFASGVCMNIQNHISKILTDANQNLNDGNVEGFNDKNHIANSVNTTVPFSDPGLYNAFVNIMNSTFTSLGIRRKLEGSMNILSPQNYFITVHEKDGKIMLAEEFDEQTKLKRYPNANQQKINKEYIYNQVSVFDTQQALQLWYKRVLPKQLNEQIIDAESVEYAKQVIKLIDENKLKNPDKNKNELSKELSELLEKAIPYLRQIQNDVIGIETELIAKGKIKPSDNDPSRTFTFQRNLKTQSYNKVHQIIVNLSETILNPEFSLKKQDEQITKKLLKDFIYDYEEDLNNQISYTPIDKNNVKIFDKVRVSGVNKKKFNIYDNSDRVNQSKLNNKEHVKDVFINVDSGFTVVIGVPNFPKLEGMIHYDNNKKRWDIKFQWSNNIKQNELTEQDIEFIDSWDYADFNDKKNIIDSIIPKDLQDYYTSGEYQKRNLELAKLPYGTWKNDPELYDKTSPDSVIRDKWGIYFINEYEEGNNNLLSNGEYYNVPFQEELDLKDYDSYQRFKNMEGDFSIEKIEGAGRRLLPQRIQFDINGATKDYYSIDSSNLMNYEKYIPTLLDQNKDLYLKKLEEYKYIVKRAVNKFNVTSPLVDSILTKISNGLGKENAFTEKERNILKNIQSMYYKELKEDHKTDLSVEEVSHLIKTKQIQDEQLLQFNKDKNWKNFYNKLLEIDLSVDITNYNEIPAEVMMPANLAKNFLLEEGDNINDITEDLLYDRIGKSYNIKDLSSLRIVPEQILLEHSGENIYVVSKNDIKRLQEEGRRIIPSYKYKGEDSSSKYIIDKNTGESIAKVNSLQFYTYKFKGKDVKLVTYDNSSDLSLLENFDDNKNLRYSILVPWNKGVSNEIISKYAKELYTNFKASLIGAMCRIPSQSKQSGMPMKIVGFIKTENNVSFVPAENLYLTGGDYDIDKIVQALLSFHRNGKIKKYNPYFLDFDSDYLIESLALPVPDNITRNVVEVKSSEEVDGDTLLLTNQECDLLSELEATHNGDFQMSLNNFQLSTLLLNKIVMSNKTKIGLIGEDFSDNSETVQSLLNNMLVDGYKLLDDPSVLENVIVGTMIQSYKDGRNALHTYAPMDSDRIKNIAKGSSKGELMAKFSPTNPITDVLMQITNMVGKDGIAISATGQKALSIIIDRYLKIKSGNFENIRLNSDLASRVSKVITGKELDQTRIINGFDLKGVGDNLVNFFRTQFNESDFLVKDPEGLLSNQEYWIKTKISSLYEEGDNSLSVSELITLSTDNAKELVLDKINASTDTLGMYMYAIAIGIDIEQFTKLMTHSTVDTIIKLSKSNVINPENSESNLDGAIKEVESGYLNPLKYSKYFDYKHAVGLVNSLMLNTDMKFAFADNVASKIYKGLIQGFTPEDFANKVDYNNFNELVEKSKKLLDKGLIKNIRIPAVVYESSDDDQDYGDEDSSGMVNISKQFYRWYQDSKKIPKINAEGMQIIDIFKTIKEESLAIKVLGQILGINQKIKTAEYDFYKYNTILSNYINKRADAWVEKTANSVSEVNGVRQVVVNVEQNKTILNALYNDGNGFDFMRFISDESYRQATINNYQLMTDSKELNILEMLSSSDHFMEMISLTYQLSENVFKPNSAKYRTLNNVINYVEKNKIFGKNGNLPKNISEDIHKKLSGYVDDLVVQSFFAQNNGLKIQIHKDDPYSYIDSTGKSIDSNKRNHMESIDLSTFEGRSKYTSWFENMIRNLQLNKYLRDENGKLKTESGFNNYFIDNIVPDSDTDFLTKEPYYFFKPSININKDMSLEDAAKKAQMIDALKELKNIKYNGHNMMDLLFLYDLIVNRGKKNKRSFATFIAEAYPMDDFNMISSKYTSYLSHIDESGIELDYSTNDFIVRGIAEKKPAKISNNMIYYDSYFNSSLHKMETYYFIGQTAFSIEKQNINKNIPLSGSVKQKTIIDPGVIISLDNSNIKITIKC